MRTLVRVRESWGGAWAKSLWRGSHRSVLQALLRFCECCPGPSSWRTFLPTAALLAVGERAIPGLSS